MTIKQSVQVIEYKNDYTPTVWEDEIIDIGEDGKPIPKRDESGNVVTDIFGNTEYVTLQDGTRYTAKRANNLEDGILNAHLWLSVMSNEMKRLKMQLEMTDRVPSSSGAFFDDFSGTENLRLIKDSTRTDLIEAVVAGATVLKVSSVEGFKELTQITVFDGSNMEHAQIASIDYDAKTITLLTALTNAYVKGAKACRSASVEKDGTMQFGAFELFSVEKAVE